MKATQADRDRLVAFPNREHVLSEEGAAALLEIRERGRKGAKVKRKRIPLREQYEMRTH
jgi:hypothetical protein